MDFSNKIAHLSIDHFSKLPKTGKPTDNQWTILATIIQEDNKANTFQVVALGTGSKCIGNIKMSPLGDILNDSHAEIICRRSFLKYLYSEIKKAIRSSSYIFEFDKTNNTFSLNNSIKFHFFTTHVPCGDAAIFPKDTSEDPGLILSGTKRTSEDNTGNSEKKVKLNNEYEGDIYRTGAKCLSDDINHDLLGNGLNYHVTGVIRTKPGRGDPTSSVSCSDKIAKWSYLGVQGALLSILLNKPVYLTSFILAADTPYSKEALNRAFHTRFVDVTLTEPFKKNNMIISQSEIPFEFQKTNERLPCSSSISWWKGIRKIEVAIDGRKQGVTKKNINTKKSRLGISKIEFFRDFMEISNMMKLKIIPILPHYGEVKMISLHYQSAWNIVKDKIFKIYTNKDQSLLHFRLD